MTLIMAAGAYLRLADLEFAQFRADDVGLWTIPHQLARQPELLTQGIISSLGIANGPFQAYLLYPASLISAGPLAAYYVVAFLNLLGVALLWAFVRRYWDPRLALLALLFSAVNPWAVIFSRRLLGNDLVAPFTVLLVWSLCDLFQHGRRRDNVLPFLWLAIAIQVYVVALVHLLLAAFALAAGVRRLRPIPFLAGIALFAVLTAPYLVAAVLPNLGSLSRLIDQPGARPEVDSTSIRLLFHIVGAEGYQAFANQAGSLLDATAGLPLAISLLTEAFLALGLTVAILQVARYCRRRTLAPTIPYLLPLIAMFLPALLLVRHTTPVYTLYLVPALPLPFLFVALGVRQTWRTLVLPSRQWRPPFTVLPRSLLAGAVLLIVATHLILAQVFFRAIREYWPKSDYGLPLRYTLDAMEMAKKLVREQGFVRVYVGGQDEHAAVLYRALQPDLPGLSHFNSAEAFQSPTGGGKALYILSSAEDRVGEAFANRFGGAETAFLAVPGYGLRYSFYGVALADLSGLFPADSADLLGVTFDGRVRLESFAAESQLRPGETHELMLRWTLLGGANQPPPSYQIYLRLVDSSQEVRYATDFQFFDAAQWQPGEQLTWWRRLPIPADLAPGAYSYLLGLYTLTPGSYRHVPAVDARGVLAGDGVRFGRLAARPPVASPPAHSLFVAFGPEVALAGYDLVDSALVPGGSLDVTLHWQPLAKMERDYTAFVHFLGPDGKLVAQHDAQPVSGRYPTSLWLPGDIVADRHTLPLPPGLAPGRYTVAVGLYDLATGERLGGADFAATFRVTVR